MRMETLGGKKEQGSIGCRPQIIIGTLNEFDQRQVRVGGPEDKATFSRLPTIDDSLSQESPPSLPLLIVSLQPELEAFSLEPAPTTAAASLSLPWSVGFLSDLSAFLWAFSNRTIGPIIDEAYKHSTPSSADSRQPARPVTLSCGFQAPYPSFSLWCPWLLLSLLPLRFQGMLLESHLILAFLR